MYCHSAVIAIIFVAFITEVQAYNHGMFYVYTSWSSCSVQCAACDCAYFKNL